MPRITPQRARARNQPGHTIQWVAMSTLFAVIGSTVGGWVGWLMGAKIGLMTGYLTSVVGSAFGVYWGRRFHADLLD
jgi:uncharacterized membrane protein YfcA